MLVQSCMGDLEVSTLTSQDTDSRDIIVRLRRIEGQARGLQRMIEEKRECDDVVTQLAALKAAVNKVCMLFIGKHIETCLACETKDEQSRLALAKATKMFMRISK